MESEFTLSDIEKTASTFWSSIGDATVITFHGSMGAGKTTFIHALCDAKGVKDPVTSPTFSLINEYEYSCEGTPRVIFHMDLYRVKNEEEAIRAGIEDCLFSGNLCLVEWPEKAPELFPPGTKHVYLDIVNTDTRRLRISDK